MEFKDKIILITGAASGIGQAAAIAFAKEGGIIVVSDINEEGGSTTVEQIKEVGGQAIFIKTDVANAGDVATLVETIVQQFGRLDIAINNAGIGGELSRTADTSVASWDKVMAINASGVFYCMKYEIGQMLKQGSGIIVNTSSIAGLKGLPNSLPYVASKHAVIGMTKTAALEYARKNIRVNAICPVFTVTPLFDPDMMDKYKEGLSERLKKTIPMRRFANVSEQVDAMMWLCSDKASFVTGLALPVDGGLTA